MKIRYLVFSYTALLLVFLVLTISQFNDISVVDNDVIALNNSIMEIKEKLDAGVIRENVESEYSCHIILLTDDYYASELNHFIKNGDQILDFVIDEKIVGKIVFPGNDTRYIEARNSTLLMVIILVAIIALLGYAGFYFIYRKYLKPFQKLESFASNVSKGNLDIPLERGKGDYFGAFSEAFDEMREALKLAREGEYRANRSKKELVASLSHDIKTPVATIKALCELLEVKINNDEVIKYIRIIDNKANIIDTLINNMFVSTLNDLEVLKIDVTEELSTIIPSMLTDLNYYNNIVFLNEIPEFLVFMDKLRLNQVIDNVINNSYKYANTKIEVSYAHDDDGLRIVIRDFGPGSTEDDLPLLTQKFYRGKNSTDIEGSGLGLYLAQLFMHGMKGDILFENDNGFVVTIFLKKI